MQRLLDTYIITAGDVGQAYAGRGYNPASGNWLTVSGSNLGSSRQTKYRLIDSDLIVQTSTGAFRQGILASTFVLHDPTNPTLATPWYHGLCSKGKFLLWHGNVAMDCGFFWRIQSGGLIAGDIVTLGVGYE
jgi:hypothetical protein